MSKLSHLDADGAARMVLVDNKPVTARRAVAQAVVTLSAETLALIMSGQAPKGDVLAVARVAGIMAAKRTHELIPLCHPLALSGADIRFAALTDHGQLVIEAEIRVVGQTGVEMEALTAASVSALTIYDMIKGVDRGAWIGDIKLLSKEGGKSGAYLAGVQKTNAATSVRKRPQELMGETHAAPRRSSLNQRREAFRAFMTARRLKALSWAKMAGIPPADLYSYLHGRIRGLEPEQEMALAKAARVNVSDMFGG